MAKGIEKGRAEGKLETAQKLLLKKMSAKDIAEVTGLSLAEIKKLAKADISKI
jgi:predicted transposase/invertase (TIGR01784 family)